MLEVTMKFKKETKGTFVYENTEKDTPVTSLYIKKTSMPSVAPRILIITITEST